MIVQRSLVAVEGSCSDMRHAQIVTYGVEGKLLDKVREWAESARVKLRPLRHPASCPTTLQREGASVVLLKTGRDLEKELALLEQISTHYPEIPTIVLGDDDHPPLAALAWDLGAACVLMPLESFETLREAIVPWLPV